MPQLDEVFYYLRGLWLMLVQPAAGLRHLDFSWRGLWRSFWAMLYCLPPILMSWAAIRMEYLSIRPANATTGPDFFFKLAVLEAVVWIVPILAMAAVMMAAGFASRIVAILVTYNWMMVPVSWMLSVYFFLMILSPGDAQGFALIYLILTMLALAGEFMVFNVLLDGNKLMVSALLLTNLVVSVYVSWKLQLLLGLV